MSYREFTLQSVQSSFHLTTRFDLLFPNLEAAVVPDWLTTLLVRTLQVPLVSEKARSELIVMPILLALRELSGDTISIFSGSRLDVDAEQGLSGEIDFLLARTPPVPEVQAPLLAILEAKKNDVEGGFGQCVAQLIGSRLFNERSGEQVPILYGCVTNGEVWQFLRLEESIITIDRQRFFLNEVGKILGVLSAIVGVLPVAV